MERFISVIIPTYNGSATIGMCLEAAFSSRYHSFEIVVVDDCSEDNSVEIVKRFPCRLIRLDSHAGASRARNVGAQNSNGEFLFFIDSDCLLQENTLAVVNALIENHDMNKTVIGGTYTPLPFDNTFFSSFQSVFVHQFETKKREPDYLATHALVIQAPAFRNSGGFAEDFLPILEDVEFSHRLRNSGFSLMMEPQILVRHIFNYTFIRSLKNAFRKSLFWTVYSLKSRDLLSDSGTASFELKINGASFFLTALSVLAYSLSQKTLFIIAAVLSVIITLFVNKGLLGSFYRGKGLLFAIAATAYYVLIYPLPVMAGGIGGAIRYLFLKGRV